MENNDRQHLTTRLDLPRPQTGIDAEGRLHATLTKTVARLRDQGRHSTDALMPQLVLPCTLGEMVEAAISLEETEPGSSFFGPTNIAQHYLEWMPSLLIEQLVTTEEPARTFFQDPLPWDQLPRFHQGIERFFGLMKGAGVDPRPVWEADDASSFRRRWPRLAELYQRTYHGGLMPLLYGMPGDMAAYAREIAEGADIWEVFDRRLAGPVLHDMLHMGRRREGIVPLYLEECIAGYLSVALMRDFAFPAVGQDNALYRAPWFSQVGRALADAVGLHPLVRAHAGQVSWSDALGDLGEAALRVGWAQHKRVRAPHFLGEIDQPEPWVRLFTLARRGTVPEDLSLADLEAMTVRDLPEVPEEDDDEELLVDALTAMSLSPRLDGQAYRVGWSTTPRQVTLDFVAGVARTVDDTGEAVRHVLPVSVCQRRVDETPSLKLVIDDANAIPRLASQLL